MATLQSLNFIVSSSSFASSSSGQPRIRASLHVPSNVRVKNINSLPKLQSLMPTKLHNEELSQIREDSSTTTSTTQQPLRQSTTPSKNDLLVSKIFAILGAVADRAEMHAIIGEQRNNWNYLFTNSVNSITLTASLMAAISSIPMGEINAAPHVLAFKLSSVVLFVAAAGVMAITSKIQPSQLAEEQRNATWLWEQLHRNNTLPPSADRVGRGGGRGEDACARQGLPALRSVSAAVLR